MKFFLLSLLIMSSLTMSESHAAGNSGSGGVAVVCRSSSGKIISAELLDLFEGRELHHLHYGDENLSVATRLKLAQLPLTHHPKYLKFFLDELSYIKANLIFVSSETQIMATNDAFPVIRKKGCEFEQLAVYTTEGKIIISKEIYQALNSANKGALYVHEVVYSLRRKLGDKNSQKARLLTAHLTADNGDQRVIDSVVKNNSSKAHCGLEGTVNERIKDCGTLKEDWSLVVRTRGKLEIWRDNDTGLIWSSQIRTGAPYPNGCHTDPEAKGWLSGSWYLPSPAQYSKANQNGILSVLPMQGNDYWTSEYKEQRLSYGHGYYKTYFVGTTFNGSNGLFSTKATSFEFAHVRCVLNTKK